MANLNINLSDLLGPDDEELAKVARWNATDTTFKNDVRIEELIYSTAKTYPDHQAVVSSNERITYNTLVTQAERLALTLIDHGVGRGSLVGIALEPSVLRLVAVLGVLRSGAAFLPLDLQYPSERLQFQLRDSGATIVVAKTELASILGLDPNSIINPIDAEVKTFIREFKGLRGTSNDTAYVIYTSGSTGQPKGAGISHLSLVNRLEWMKNMLALTQDDRILHKTAFGFDVSIWEQLLPLTVGATLVVATQEIRRDALALQALVDNEKITVLHFVPTMLDAFLESVPVGACPTLRAIICSGETLPRSTALRCRNKIEAALYNYYGPTETAIDVTSWKFDPLDPYQFVPIGCPIANVSIHVLGPDLQPLPIGTEGELCVGGVAVGIGYIGRPRMTAERFIPDPISAAPGAKLYRTGDMARWHEDGFLEYLGRRDDQVKIRGFRIELGEIEEILRCQEGVAQAAVSVCQDNQSSRLVAFIVSVNLDNNPTNSLLEERCRTFLPDYMVPNNFVFLKKLPVTVNGKLDRSALVISAKNTLENDSPSLPETYSEILLTELWSSLLGCEITSIDMNFFALGGDSISAIRLVARARAKGLIFEIKDVFDHPTIHKLASVARIVEKTTRKIQFEKQIPASQKLWLNLSDIAVTLRAPIGAFTFSKALDIKQIQYTLRNIATQLCSIGDLDTTNHSPAGCRIKIRSDADWDTDRQLTVAIERVLSVMKSETDIVISAELILPDSGNRGLIIALHPRVADWQTLMLLPAALDCPPNSERTSLSGLFMTVPYRIWSASIADSKLPAGSESYPLLLTKTNHCEFSREVRVVSTNIHDTEARYIMEDANHLLPDAVATAFLSALQKAGVKSTLVELAESRAWGARQGWNIDFLSGRIGVSVSVYVALQNISADLNNVRLLRNYRLSGRRDNNLSKSGQIRVRFIHLPDVGELTDNIQLSSALPLAIARQGANIGEITVVTASINGKWLVVCGFYANEQWGACVANAVDNLQNHLCTILGHPEWPCVRIPADFPLTSVTATEIATHPHILGQAVDVYPLSPMQKGLLLRAIYWPESDAYHNQNVIEIQGPFNISAFQTAWNKTVQRYEVLRTGYIWRETDEPLQFVMSEATTSLQIIDWSHYSNIDVDSELDKFLKQDRRRPFNMLSPGLFRIALVKLSSEEYLIIWSHHHILLDGWCLSLIWGDCFKLYEATVNKIDACLVRPRPYRDYVAWLRNRKVDNTDRSFWRKYLEDFEKPALLSKQNQNVEGFFKTWRIQLNIEETKHLSTFARRIPCTVNAVIQAAWSILLSQQTGLHDIIHGVSVSGRPPELEGSEAIVGLFINTVPLRLKHSFRATVRNFLHQVQATLAGAGRHSYVPLAEIISEWKERYRASDRLFDSLIAFENYPEDNLPEGLVGGVKVQDRFAEEKTEYPFGLIVLPGDRLELHFNFDSMHFPEEKAQELVDSYLLILRTLVEDPNRVLSEVAPLPFTVRNCVSKVWADGGSAAKDVSNFYNLLANIQQPSITPAIIDGERTWSYDELADRSNAVAQLLYQAGISRGDIVAICIERSNAFAAAVIGVMKIGAVPAFLNPESPVNFIESILEEISPKSILTGENFSTCVNIANLPLINVWEALLLPINKATSKSIPTPNGAYIFFTSGSTGKPKAIICSLKGLINRLSATHQLYCIEQPRLLMNAAPSFDIVLWELFFPLMLRGTVVIATDETVHDPALLANLIRSEFVTAIHLVPSLLDVLLESASLIDLHSLKLVATGGEVVSPTLVSRFYQTGLSAQLWQAYGPTEASISVTDYLCQPADSILKRIPIGRPTKGCCLYVLNQSLQLVPAEVEGDLYIGGIAPALGYLGSPAETACSFLPDPFSEKGTRMYRTGDRAIWRSDGLLEFCGRIDAQVKIRGHRVEPSFVESILMKHPFVKTNAVVGRPSQTGDLELVAFVVLKKTMVQPGETQALQLRRWLEQELSKWLIPNKIELIDRLPLTSNGKVDRHALIISPLTLSMESLHFPEEISQLEQIITKTWKEVLGKPPIDRHANFFEWGGHSLLAMRFVAVMKHHLGPNSNIEVSHLLKFPTVAGLAEAIFSPIEGSGEQYVTVIREGGYAPPLILIHPVEGLSLTYCPLANHIHDRSVYAINNPRFGSDRTFTSLEEMASLYVEWTRALSNEGPVVLGGWSFGGVVALEMARQMVKHGSLVQLVLMVDSYNLASYSHLNSKVQEWSHYLDHLSLEENADMIATIKAEIQNNTLLAMASQSSSYCGRVILLQAEPDSNNKIDLELNNGWDLQYLPKMKIHHLLGRHQELFLPYNITTTASAIMAALNTDEQH